MRRLMMLSSLFTFGTCGQPLCLDLVGAGVRRAAADAWPSTVLRGIDPFGPNPVHYFGGTPPNPILRAADSVRESAAGIADVVGRMKINLGQGRRYGGALLTEVRLPTGDEANLRGAGSTSARAVGVVGAQFGSFSLHSNAGYLLRTGTLQNDAPIDIPFPFARRLGARAQRRRAAQESRDSAVVLLDHRARDQLLIDVGRTRYLVHPA